MRMTLDDPSCASTPPSKVTRRVPRIAGEDERRDQGEGRDGAWPQPEAEDHGEGGGGGDASAEPGPAPRARSLHRIRHRGPAAAKRHVVGTAQRRIVQRATQELVGRIGVGRFRPASAVQRILLRAISVSSARA
jgi:hypothetical protein